MSNMRLFDAIKELERIGVNIVKFTPDKMLCPSSTLCSICREVRNALVFEYFYLTSRSSGKSRFCCHCTSCGFMLTESLATLHDFSHNCCEFMANNPNKESFTVRSNLREIVSRYPAALDEQWYESGSKVFKREPTPPPQPEPTRTNGVTHE